MATETSNDEKLTHSTTKIHVSTQRYMESLKIIFIGV